MSPDELFQAAQQAAAQIRSEMEQAPAPSPVLALLHEQIGLTVYHQTQSQQRGSAVLQIAGQMAEQRAAEAEQPPAQEVPVIPGRPPGGIIEHVPPPPGESAQEKAEAQQREREAEQARALVPDADPSLPAEPEG